MTVWSHVKQPELIAVAIATLRLEPNSVQRVWFATCATCRAPRLLRHTSEKTIFVRKNHAKPVLFEI